MEAVQPRIIIDGLGYPLTAIETIKGAFPAPRVYPMAMALVAMSEFQVKQVLPVSMYKGTVYKALRVVNAHSTYVARPGERGFEGGLVPPDNIMALGKPANHRVDMAHVVRDGNIFRALNANNPPDHPAVKAPILLELMAGKVQRPRTK